MTNLDTAKAVLAKASLLDQTFANPDIAIAVAWSEALGAINAADACAAVTRHYSQPGCRRILPGDVIAGVRQIRRERLARYGNTEPDYDGDDVAAGLAAIRAHRARIAAGEITEPAHVIDGPRKADVATLVTRTAAQLPRIPRDAS